MPRGDDRSAPELLAPAGNWDCLRAAVAAGADAVYFGLPVLNARMRADNFRTEELPDIVRYLHERGVKAHVTLNTLVFTDELPRAGELLVDLGRAGVDAVILQDLGAAALARAVAPGVEIHASTQMTITSPEGARFAAGLGAERIVLARELSLAEIARFSDDDIPPLEVFVHGALCVAYSGQCLTSESLGRRSANRGECAQACRMAYDLVVDGRVVDLGDRKYLLSPQDLVAVEEVPELIRLGVRCFKIEGRLKSPEYVAAVTDVYRRAIDAATRDQPLDREDDDRYRLEMTFSRGLFSGWLHGVDHQRLVHARFGKKRGPFVGRVARKGRDWVELERPPEGRVVAGDGLVFDAGPDTEHETGGRVFEVSGSRLTFGRGRVDLDRVHVGDRVWKTHDPRLERELRAMWRREVPPEARELDLVVAGRVGEPLELSCELDGRPHAVRSSRALEAARERPLGREILERQLGRLGGTRWRLGSLSLRLEGHVIVPVSELNRMRRALIASLDAEQQRSRPAGASSGEAASRVSTAIAALSPAATTGTTAATESPRLIVLCRTLEQLETVIALGVTELVCDFEDPRRYRDAVAMARGAGEGTTIALATPRIQKAGEHGLFRPIEIAAPDAVLVRNLGGMHWFRDRGLRLVGDFSLNVANPITARLLMEEGLEAVTVSYDLDAAQVLDLARATPPAWLELTIHQHMPMFHMEHCVFAAFLSEGKDHTDCGRPCDHHRLHLRDRVGMEHPIAADVGCRNTVFNQRAQSGAAYFREFAGCGIRRFRVELLEEGVEDTRAVVDAYRRLLAGEVAGEAVARTLRVRSQLGVTTGTLTV